MNIIFSPNAIQSFWNLKNTNMKNTLLLFLIAIALWSCTESSKKSELSADEKKALTSFITQFSEVETPYFAENEITDSVLLHFGVYHTWLVNPKAFEECDSATRACIGAKMVHDTAFLYLGKEAKKDFSFGDCEWADGKFKVLLGDGEAYTFSQFSSLISDSNDVIRFNAIEFVASSGWTGNIHGDSLSWTKDTENGELIPQKSNTLKVAVKRIKKENKTSYQLLEFKKIS